MHLVTMVRRVEVDLESSAGGGSLVKCIYCDQEIRVEENIINNQMNQTQVLCECDKTNVIKGLLKVSINDEGSIFSKVMLCFIMKSEELIEATTEQGCGQCSKRHPVNRHPA